MSATLIGVLGMIVLVELMSSEVLIYRYRHAGLLNDGSVSGFVLLKKAAYELGWTAAPHQFVLESIPSPFLKRDPVYGWSAIPGKYTHIFKRKRESGDGWEALPVNVTINSDQTRWTGMSAQSQKPTIYVLGDSEVFGWGVNDEQTFSYYLQTARPDYNVKLFALGGYGLVQSYLRIQQLRSEITDRDIVIIGYADFYDKRNVAAPSRLRELERWIDEKNAKKLGDESKIPKASIGSDSQLSITLVEQDCRLVRSYCNSEDPSVSAMRAVSLRLVHEIADATKAKTYLLYFDGSKDNPVVQNCGVEVISALQQDFDYFIRDDIAGFDHHPGPYWHYAIAQKLASKIR